MLGWALTGIHNLLLVLHTSTVHPRLSEPRLSKHNISQATPTLRMPRGSWRFQILQNDIFQSPKAMLSAENVGEKLDICKLMAKDRSYMEHYRSRRLTAVAKS